MSSRQPPRSGGVPPRPRSRSPAAKRQARESAAMARLSIFTVGLTRIELVTSSLSGMRSNQLSYSPELLSGEMSLLPLSVTLNRGYQNLFFQYRYPNSAHKIGDQVENRCQKHPQTGAENYTE